MLGSWGLVWEALWVPSASRASGAAAQSRQSRAGAPRVSAPAVAPRDAPLISLTPTPTPARDVEPFPFQRLDVYIQSRELAACVRRANIGDTQLRDLATRAANSSFLSISEALPDDRPRARMRSLAAARNSLCELAATVDLAVCTGALPQAAASDLVGRARRVAGVLTGLMRRAPRRANGPHAEHEPTTGAEATVSGSGARTRPA